MKQRLNSAPPNRARFEWRALVLASLAAIPFAVLALLPIIGIQPDLHAGLAWFVMAVFFWWLSLRWLRHSIAYPLRTVSTLLEALREGDYLMRGRLDAPEDALGEVVREVNLLRDTLHRQRAQVLETLALLRKVIETADMAVFTFGPEHRLKLVNAAGRKLLGLEDADEDQLGKLDATTLGLTEFLETPGPFISDREFAGGSGRWEVKQRTFIENGQTHYLLVLSDLSRALREEERGAWHRLIRVMGHEINNSLVPIQSLTEVMESRLRQVQMPSAVATDLHEAIDLIAGRAESLRQFISGYTLLARLPQLEIQQLNLSELIHRVALLQDADRVRCRGQDLHINADPVQLEQLLINLVKNALEAADEDSGEVELSWSKQRDEVLIEVADNGPGLPQSDNIFVPFFTTKPKGSGIGLVLCRRIAEAHGGQLTLSNHPKGGCLAMLRLPAS